LPNPAIPPKVDTVVMETTYGDRLHKRLKPSIGELYEVVNNTVDHGSNVIIPAFAMEGAQEILYFLREGLDKGDIRHFTNVFLDASMAMTHLSLMVCISLGKRVNRWLLIKLLERL